MPSFPPSPPPTLLFPPPASQATPRQGPKRGAKGPTLRRVRPTHPFAPLLSGRGSKTRRDHRQRERLGLGCALKPSVYNRRGAPALTCSSPSFSSSPPPSSSTSLHLHFLLVSLCCPFSCDSTFRDQPTYISERLAHSLLSLISPAPPRSCLPPSALVLLPCAAASSFLPFGNELIGSGAPSVPGGGGG